MQAGINKLVKLIRPTLGPLPHVVGIEPVSSRNNLPELLDSGGTIARRVIQLSDRGEDVGAMYLRHVLWRLQEKEGDGTATAAFMFSTLYNLGLRYVIAGGNAMILRQHLEKGMKVILNAIDPQITQLHGKKELAGLAQTICYDEELAKMLGEIFDIIGTYGRLDVRKGDRRELSREYVEGMYWDGSLRSRDMTNAGLRANLENAYILISDLEINSPDQLIPLLGLAIKNDIKQLLLVSNSLSDKAIGLLLNKQNKEKVFVVAVKTPGLASDVRQEALEDLAILTGGRALIKASGDTLEKVTLEDLGVARRIWAEHEFFGIVGGRGNPRALREHIATLRKIHKNADDPADRQRSLERLGKLIGGSATLRVGDISPTAVERRVELAKRTADAMRGAMREGVVPGGGIALLDCRDALRPCLKNAQDTDERAAYQMLLTALEAPFRVIVENGGFLPGKALAEIERGEPGCGFDVLKQKVVNMREAGIFDSASVVKSVVRSAVSGVGLALTTDVIIHRKNPPEGFNT